MLNGKLLPPRTAAQVIQKAADIQNAISEGASSFLATEYKYLSVFMVRYNCMLCSGIFYKCMTRILLPGHRVRAPLRLSRRTVLYITSRQPGSGRGSLCCADRMSR